MSLPTNFDEADLPAEIERLSSEATRLESLLRDAKRHVPVRPALTNGDLIHQSELLESHLSILRTSASLANIKLPEARPAPTSSLPTPTGKTQPGAPSH